VGWQITGNKIFTYEIGREYAARVENLRAYDVVSQDVIHRWTYPMVPDIPFGGNNSGMRLERCNVYKGTGLFLLYFCNLVHNWSHGDGECM
jgi:translation initiation factor eIF-2B subunit epsilon